MKPEYIDIHAHVNFKDYDNDRDQVLLRAQENNVWMINVGTDYKTSKEVVELAENNENLFTIIGLHPTDIDEEFDVEKFRELAKSPKVVGIGECGLDFFRLPEDKDLAAEITKKQKRTFKTQIELAIELNLPLMIHARNSYAEILEIIDEYLSIDKGRLRGNVHFFAGTSEEAKAFLERGFTLSFTGAITFGKGDKNQYKELIEAVPLDMIMAETDCPFVAPVPFRGTRNEPLYVREVAAKIAEIKGIDLEIVKKALVDNAFRLFAL